MTISLNNKKISLIDITSDIHVDSWVNVNLPEKRQVQLITDLINYSMPDEPSNTIIVAGDIGHYNYQNILYFKTLKLFYKNVIWVHGNHDLYLLNPNIQKKYNYDSFNRLNEMIELSDRENNIHYLNGNIIELDGYTFGGTAMWYNNDYAKEFYKKTDEECLLTYKNYMYDSKHIITKKIKLDYLEYYALEKEKMLKICDKCDVIVSHIGPDYSTILNKWQSPESTFFYFNGDDLLKKAKKGSIWIYGHTHDKYYFKNKYGVTMICNPFDYGYLNKYWQMNKFIENKYITIDLDDTFPSYEKCFKNTI